MCVCVCVEEGLTSEFFTSLCVKVQVGHGEYT